MKLGYSHEVKLQNQLHIYLFWVGCRAMFFLYKYL